MNTKMVDVFVRTKMHRTESEEKVRSCGATDQLLLGVGQKVEGRLEGECS